MIESRSSLEGIDSIASLGQLPGPPRHLYFSGTTTRDNWPSQQPPASTELILLTKWNKQKNTWISRKKNISVHLIIMNTCTYLNTYSKGHSLVGLHLNPNKHSFLISLKLVLHHFTFCSMILSCHEAFCTWKEVTATKAHVMNCVSRESSLPLLTCCWNICSLWQHTLQSSVWVVTIKCTHNKEILSIPLPELKKPNHI